MTPTISGCKCFITRVKESLPHLSQENFTAKYFLWPAKKKKISGHIDEVVQYTITTQTWFKALLYPILVCGSQWTKPHFQMTRLNSDQFNYELFSLIYCNRSCKTEQSQTLTSEKQCTPLLMWGLSVYATKTCKQPYHLKLIHYWTWTKQLTYYNTSTNDNELPEYMMIWITLVNITWVQVSEMETKKVS